MGCADICITAEYDNGPEFHRAKVQRASKPYRCCECRDAIPAGAQYENVTGKWAGEMETYRTCLVCVEIRLAFCCNGWVYAQLWEGIREEMFPEWRKNLAGIECLAKLKSDAAIAKMRERYAEWNDD